MWRSKSGGLLAGLSTSHAVFIAVVVTDTGCGGDGRESSPAENCLRHGLVPRDTAVSALA